MTRDAYFDEGTPYYQKVRDGSSHGELFQNLFPLPNPTTVEDVSNSIGVPQDDTKQCV